MINRKAFRKKERLEKKKKKANHYVQRKMLVKQEKAEFWKKKTAMPIVSKTKLIKAVENRPVKKYKDVKTLDITTDPLLLYAERAIEQGILNSDGEFDEDVMDEALSQEEDFVSEEDEIAQSSFSEEDNENIKDSTDTMIDSKFRKASSKSADESIANKISKMIQGNLNRLSLSNLESITTHTVTICKECSRAEFASTIMDCILNFLLKQVNLLDSYILTYAAFLIALGGLENLDLIPDMVEKCIIFIDEFRTRRKLDKKTSKHQDEIGEDFDSSSKGFRNIFTFISFLYNMQAITKSIICDVMEELAQNISEELEVEVTVKAIRLCGAQLRRDDPLQLKKLISKFQSLISDQSRASNSSRIKFLGEVLDDLRNNRQKLVAVQHGELEMAKKSLRTIFIGKGLKKLEPFNLTLNDLRNGESRGRWWKVGAAWKDAVNNNNIEPDKNSFSDSKDDKIMDIAKQQHMNTDKRKIIFKALMSSEDYQDAFNRILQLRPSAKDQKEIIHVILHCLNHEKLYNPFYSSLSRKLIASSHNYAVTFKHSFWDRIKTLDDSEISLREIVNTSKFYANLLMHQTLPLSILKKVSFVDCGSSSTFKFFKILLTSLFKECPEDIKLIGIFNELTEKQHHDKKKLEMDIDDDPDHDTNETDIEIANLRIGLKAFLGHLSNEDDVNDNLVRKIGIAISCL